MVVNMDLLRKKLQEEDKRQKNFEDRAVYRFWDAPYEERVVIRFLPDGDENNPFFWVKKETIKLTFHGTTEDLNEQVTLYVPCVEMYGKRCPILAELRKIFKSGDDDLVEKARNFWKKTSYVFQGFVVDSPIEEEELPENPIRRFTINKQLFSVIRGGLLDPDLEVIPVDYDRGRDFFIVRTKQGQYSSYIQSKWSMKERPLSEEERNAIKKYGLWNLKDFLPAEPTDKELSDYYDMFCVAFTEKPFDTDKWAKYYLRNNGKSVLREEFIKNGESVLTVENDHENDDNDDVDIPSKTEILKKIEEGMKKTRENLETTTKTDPRDIIARIKRGRT